jgi:hypothetical protein
MLRRRLERHPVVAADASELRADALVVGRHLPEHESGTRCGSPVLTLAR